MKYLLILLFLFSAQTFSGEIDGKGLYCRLTNVDKYYGKGYYTHKYSAFIFKSSKYKLWTIEVNKNNRTVKINKTKRKAYYTTGDNINLSPYGLLNRKNLQLTTTRCEAEEDEFMKCYSSVDSSPENAERKRKHTVKVTSQCKVYTDIKKLKKKIKSEMSWVKQNLEDEHNKKSKGNKI